MRRSKYILFILMAVMVLFTGCVKKYKENNNNIEKAPIEYKVVKFEIPDPDDAFIEQQIVTKNDANDLIEEKLYRIHNGVIYRIVQVNLKTVVWGIQKLEYPYENWDTTIISAEEWYEGRLYELCDCTIAPNGVIKLVLSEEYQGKRYYDLSEWRAGSILSCKDITEQYEKITFKDHEWYIDGIGNHYFFNEQSLMVYNMLFGERDDYAFEGTIDDIVLNNNNEAFFAGMLKKGVYKGLYKTADREPAFWEEILKAAPDTEPHYVWDKNNDILVIDKEHISKIGYELSRVYSFSEADLSLEKIQGIIYYNDAIYLLGTENQDDILLLISEKEKTDL